ncbi:hypothetical protein ACIPD2_39155 [Streptomyces griseofuscus]|uniref:hypothetical protein n=1 Tax=Streptomyces TaxID=1883 RepID=UPI0019265365|nr:hypothetical protein [Streptomyces sp. SID685]
MRKLAVGVLAAALFATGAGTAFATSWHTIPTLKTGGAEFNHGKYTFWPAGQNHGAFEWKGNLKDADPNDGHGVYIQVKVEGYSWSRVSGQQKKTVPLDRLSWDGAERYTVNAYLRVCRDRGSFHPDNCSVTKHYKR